MATHDRNNSLLLHLQARKFRNVVVREVRDQESYILGRILQPHDGTEEGVVAAAQAATDRMYIEFSLAGRPQGTSRFSVRGARPNPDPAENRGKACPLC